jgi:hypothetical protein
MYLVRPTPDIEDVRLCLFVCLSVCLSVRDLVSASKALFGFACNSVIAIFTRSCYASLSYVKIAESYVTYGRQNIYLDIPYFLSDLGDILYKIYPRIAIEDIYICFMKIGAFKQYFTQESK